MIFFGIIVASGAMYLYQRADIHSSSLQQEARALKGKATIVIGVDAKLPVSTQVHYLGSEDLFTTPTSPDPKTWDDTVVITKQNLREAVALRDQLLKVIYDRPF